MKTTTETKTRFWHHFNEGHQESAVICAQWRDELTPLIEAYHAALDAQEADQGALPAALHKVAELQGQQNEWARQRLAARDANAAAESSVKLMERRTKELPKAAAKKAKGELEEARQIIADATRTIENAEKGILEIKPKVAVAEKELARAKAAQIEMQTALESARQNLFTVALWGDCQEHVMPLIDILIEIYRRKKIEELEKWSDGAPNFDAKQLLFVSPLPRMIEHFKRIFKDPMVAKKNAGIYVLADVLDVICAPVPDFQPLLQKYNAQ